MQPSTSEQSSKYDLCRELTSFDVDQALYPLKINKKQTNEQSTVPPKQECDCCRFLRARSSLPLARRGRPHIPARSHRLLCSNCTEIKRQQQIDILQTQQKYPSKSVYQMLVWKIDGNTNDSLTENDKKILLDETIKKLQMTIYDQDNFEFTYRTLQTTINILSSSHNSI